MKSGLAVILDQLINITYILTKDLSQDGHQREISYFSCESLHLKFWPSYTIPIQCSTCFVIYVDTVLRLVVSGCRHFQISVRRHTRPTTDGGTSFLVRLFTSHSTVKRDDCVTVDDPY